MPTNLYGPGDNYSLENSHVLPAFIRGLMKQEKILPSPYAGDQVKLLEIFTC